MIACISSKPDLDLGDEFFESIDTIATRYSTSHHSETDGEKAKTLTQKAFWDIVAIFVEYDALAGSSTDAFWEGGKLLVDFKKKLNAAHVLMGMSGAST